MRASVAVLAAAGLMTFACGSQLPPTTPSTPPPATPPAQAAKGSVTGTWSGSGADSFSAEQVTWVLTQSDSTITGRAELSPIDPADGDVPTPICTTDLSGTATVVANQLTGAYSGTDSCEGFYSNGQLTLTRQP